MIIAAFRIIKLVILTGLAVLLLPRLITLLFSIQKTYSVTEVPAKPVAIVFGAGLWRDGTPTTVLRDCLATAAELYFSGKVQKILLSGDNRYVDYNEPGAMRNYLLNLGVPDAVMTLDYAGRRTYDTCYRARAIFCIQAAILVTQGFHLPMALITCHALGIKVVGIPSDRTSYRLASQLFWNLRELPATLTALVDIYLVHPQPVLGDPQPIFPAMNQ